MPPTDYDRADEREHNHERKEDKMELAINHIQVQLRELIREMGELNKSSAVHGKWLESIDEKFGGVAEKFGQVERKFGILNGSVATTIERVAKDEVWIATHPITCEVGDQVEHLREEVAADRAAHKSELTAVRADLVNQRDTDAKLAAERQKWWQVVRPVLIRIGEIVLAIIGILVLSQADLFKHLFVKG